MVPRILEFLESRTGLVSQVKHFLDEDIPDSAGWHQVLGSVALFFFLIQVFTGLLLAFNYAPTPGEAYNSVRYIVSEVTGGKLIRGLHHWGASMMIVIVALHMVQAFLWGAYKKPREATWIVGIILLQVVLAFGLTGYLLPWDNRAYWGTVVTTQIAAKAPFAGQYLSRLMGSEGGGVGVVTFARFYTLHVMLLPVITMLLVGLHVFLVRRHGVTPAPGDELKPKKKFYPGQVMKDTVATFVAFAALFTLAIVAEAPLGRLADPTDTSYIPRPEWYFLFLFQTLKFFEGPLEVVGSVVLPGLAITLLALAPFIDRGMLKRVQRRGFAIALVAMGAITWASLTTAAIVTTPKEALRQDEPENAPQEWQALSPEELAGAALFKKENCLACHQIGAQGKAVGPDLPKAASKRDAGWHIAHFKRPVQLVPGSIMPPVRLSDQQLNALAALMLKLSPRNAESIVSVPANILEGALTYHRFQCGICHMVNGIGQKTGPPLNGLSRRRDRQWVADHFADPKKLSPGSTMPPYKFSGRELGAITDYLLSLPASQPQ